MQQGKIKFYDSKKGFGFIDVNQEKDIYYHISQVSTPGYIPKEADEVTFETKKTKKGTMAINIAKA